MKAKDLATDIDDVEFEDWCVANTHAHFWYCADVWCVGFLAGTVHYKSMINLCFTMPATFIFTKFVPNKLITIYITLP